MTLSVTSLFSVATAAELLSAGLDLATAVGLPVTSWRPGDPTRSLYKFLADSLATWELTASDYVKSGFLSTATGDWLTVLALEVYGATRTEATYATSTLTLTNSGGGYYVMAAGDASFKASSTGKTYHSTSTFTLAGTGTTATVTVEADEAGTDSAAGIDDIDTIVTTMLGVSVTSSTAAVAIDSQEDESLREQCRATLGALSPNGPPDAYEYVARNPDLTGTTEITRASSTEDSSTGVVTVYVASASGTVSAPSVALAQAAIDIYATPLCITATVVSASTYTVPVYATVTANGLPANFATLATAAVNALTSSIDIGGTLACSAYVAVLHDLAVSLGATRVSVVLTLPNATFSLLPSQIAIPGTVVITTALP